MLTEFEWGRRIVYRRDSSPFPQRRRNFVSCNGRLCTGYYYRKRSNGSVRIICRLPKFTLVGATTRAGQLSAPLRDRFGVVLGLEMYTPQQLAEIVTRSAQILGIPIEADESVGD